MCDQSGKGLSDIEPELCCDIRVARHGSYVTSDLIGKRVCLGGAHSHVPGEVHEVQNCRHSVHLP